MKTNSTIEKAAKRFILLMTALLAITSAAAQEKKDLTIKEKVVNNTVELLHGTKDFIENTLDGKDSLYVSPNLYNLTVMPQYSYCYDYYRFSAVDAEQSITLVPGSRHKLGLYLGWRWLFLGYSFELGGNAPQTDINLSFYTAAAGIDLFYRKRSEGYRIRSLKGFKEGNEDIKEYNHRFDGLSVQQKGVNVYYIFNNKKFSYPAAYSQSTNQRISAGSFILGLTYNEQSFHFDHTKFDDKIEERLNQDLKFRDIKYKDFSINFGYSYNWVFAKDFLANISMTPAIGYKNTSLKLHNRKEFLSSLNFDFITRAAIVYNNSRYYAGASLVAHTYSYNKSTISILNGFGVVNVYFGINFWRRK